VERSAEVKAKALINITLILCAGLLSILYGCSKNRVEELNKERLFVIPIGNGEEEIGVQREANGQFLGPGEVLFKNGFYYVVDSVNQKILKITTPGDVILVLSKGEQSNGNRAEEENLLRTKQRKFFQFNNIGQIAVDNENNIYVEDKIIQKTPQKTVLDLFSDDGAFEEENGEMYVSYIFKFDRLGNLLYKLGINGKDSDPFYYIYKVEVDENGNLLILTADEEWLAWSFYKYNPQGSLVFRKEVSSEQIFDNKGMDDTAFFIMDVLPVSNSDHIVYWISLYDTTYDTKNIKKEEEIWGEEIEIEDFGELDDSDEKEKKDYVRDLLYYKLLYYNLDTGEIDRSFKWEYKLDNPLEGTEEFFGIDGNTNGFFWKYLSNTKAIISIINANGTMLARRSFVFEDDGLWTNVKVAGDGSVSALKIERKLLYFYRWRSDRLISNKQEHVTLKEFVKDKIWEFKHANR
jgi:hypothetical protein